LFLGVPALEATPLTGVISRACAGLAEAPQAFLDDDCAAPVLAELLVPIQA